nr:hypothetical protein [Tanacetum cinerariifolium]
FPPTNNQFRTSSNPRSHATVHEGKIVTETIQRKAPGNVSNAGTKGNQGYMKKTNRNGKKVIYYNCCGEGHVAKECNEPKRSKDAQYYKDKMMLSDAKDRGVILDAKAEAFLADVKCTEPYDESLALTATTAFQVSHEDVYDSDVDDGPHVAATFMANLSSTEEANGTSSSKINEYLLLTEDVVPPTETPSETYYVSPGEIYLQDQITAIIPQLEGHIKTNKDLSRANESLKAELAQCKLEMQSLERNKVKHDLDQAIVDRSKQNAKLEQENSLLKTTLNKEESIKALNEKNNKVVSEKKDLDERNLEEIVCLQKANRTTRPTHVPSSVWETEETIALGAESRAKMFEKPGTVKPINYDAVETQFLPFLNMFKKLVYQFKEVLVKEVKEFEKTFDELDGEYVEGVKKIKSLEITNRNLVCEIECLTSDSIANDVCAIVRTAAVRMPLDAEISSSCVRELYKGLELEAEIAKKNKMLSELEKRCSYIKKYYIDLEIKFQEYRDCFESPNVCDYSRSPAYNAFFEINKLKDHHQGKDITIKQLQTQLKDATVVQVGPTNSRPTQPEKPKLLAPGMFTISTKYIPLPRRENWVAPAPKPRKKQVTFREPPRPSHSTTQKTVMQMIKKSNPCVHLSTGVKTAFRVSKPTLKRVSHTNRCLPAKQEGGHRVEAHTRNLNKQNRVDSRVNFKHSGFVSKHFPVCNDCGECLFSRNHDACVVHYLKRVNTKRSNFKNVVTPVRKVWRPVSKNAARTTSQWKPTGRTFSFYATYPLTRIAEPLTEPLDQT